MATSFKRSTVIVLWSTNFVI